MHALSRLLCIALLLGILPASAGDFLDLTVTEKDLVTPTDMTPTSALVAIQAQMDIFRRCLLKGALKQVPLHAGQVRVTLEFKPTGAVKSSNIVSSTLRHPFVERCLEDGGWHLRFDRTKPTKGSLSFTLLLTNPYDKPR